VAPRIGGDRNRNLNRFTLQTFGEARRGHLCRENEAMDPELDSAQFLSLEVRVRSNRQLRASAASQRIAQERVLSPAHHVIVN